MSNSVNPLDQIVSGQVRLRDLIWKEDLPEPEIPEGTKDLFEESRNALQTGHSVEQMYTLLESGTMLDPATGRALPGQIWNRSSYEGFFPEDEEAESKKNEPVNPMQLFGTNGEQIEQKKSTAKDDLIRRFMLRQDVKKLWVCAPGSDRPYEVSFDKKGTLQVSAKPLTQDEMVMSMHPVEPVPKPGLFSKVLNWFHHLRSPFTDIPAVSRYKDYLHRVEQAHAAYHAETRLAPMHKNNVLEAGVKKVMELYAGHDSSAQERCRGMWNWIAKQDDAEYLLAALLDNPRVLGYHGAETFEPTTVIKGMLQEKADSIKFDHRIGRGNPYLNPLKEEDRINIQNDFEPTEVNNMNPFMAENSNDPVEINNGNDSFEINNNNNNVNPIQYGGENPIQYGGENPFEYGSGNPIQYDNKNPFLYGGKDPIEDGSGELPEDGGEYANPYAVMFPKTENDPEEDIFYGEKDEQRLQQQPNMTPKQEPPKEMNMQQKLFALSGQVVNSKGELIGVDEHYSFAGALKELKDDDVTKIIPTILSHQDIGKMQKIYDIYAASPEHFAENVKEKFKDALKKQDDVIKKASEKTGEPVRQNNKEHEKQNDFIGMNFN